MTLYNDLKFLFSKRGTKTSLKALSRLKRMRKYKLAKEHTIFPIQPTSSYFGVAGMGGSYFSPSSYPTFAHTDEFNIIRNIHNDTIVLHSRANNIYCQLPSNSVGGIYTEDAAIEYMIRKMSSN